MIFDYLYLLLMIEWLHGLFGLQSVIEKKNIHQTDQSVQLRL